MRRSTVLACFLVLTSSVCGAVALAAPRRAAAPRSEPQPDCASVYAEIRMEAYGYTHLVTVSNRCKRPVTCEVWTDVDPTPHQTLRVEPGESASAITRRGSPARQVTAGSDCRLQ